MRYFGGSCTNVLRELPELAYRLEARYPGVRVVQAYIGTTTDDEPQQNIRYHSPLALLKQYGLVTDWMLAHMRDSYGETELGDGFSLHDDVLVDTRLALGCWALSVYTGTTPRDWHRRPSTKKLQRIAAKLLRPILTPAASSLQGRQR